LTPTAALPLASAASRVMRAAAGRRALQVGLLVGGLFALGFLFGEQAHAAEGAPTGSTVPTVSAVSATELARSATGALRPVERSVRSVRSVRIAVGHAVKGSPIPTAHTRRPGTPARPAEPVATDPVPTATDSVPSVGDPVGSVGDAVPAATDGVRHVVRPVADGLVRPVGEQVVQPVGNLVETVTGGLADASSQLPQLPSLPSLPALPSLPGLLPGLPGLPGVPTPPGQTPPGPSSPESSDGGAVDHHGSVEGRESVVYGPRAVCSGAVPVGERHAAQGGAAQVPAPAHQAPGGDPTGMLGDQSAVDNGAPRHGDAHAATLNHRAPLRLVPGATAVVTADATRDRHRDIPEFPG